MSISPKSAIASNDNQTHVPDLDKLIPMNSFDPEEDPLQIRLGEMETEIVAEDTEKRIFSSGIPSTKVEAMGAAQKRDKIVLCVSLIHGDIMILSGDDFEVCIRVILVTRLTI
jgi:hypothetical protein